MRFFISVDKNFYYEAPDRFNPNDLEVPRRPSEFHVFTNGMWIDNSQNRPPQGSASFIQQPMQSQANNLSELVNVIKQLQSINPANQPAQSPAVPNQPGMPTNTQNDKHSSGFLGTKFTWKDAITLVYFAGGLVGLWVNINERILILEQKVQVIERSQNSLGEDFKENSAKTEGLIRSLENRVNDFQYNSSRSKR